MHFNSLIWTRERQCIFLKNIDVQNASNWQYVQLLFGYFLIDLTIGRKASNLYCICDKSDHPPRFSYFLCMFNNQKYCTSDVFTRRNLNLEFYTNHRSPTQNFPFHLAYRTKANGEVGILGTKASWKNPIKRVGDQGVTDFFREQKKSSTLKWWCYGRNFLFCFHWFDFEMLQR